MADVLSKLLKWIEIGCVLVIVVAIFFRLLSLPFSGEILLVGLLTLATVYFLGSFRVVTHNAATSKMGLADILPFTLTKVMFIGISVLCIAYLFTILHLKGANEMMIVGLLTLILCVCISAVMISGKRDRMTILKPTLIRSILALLFYFVTPLLNK